MKIEKMDIILDRDKEEQPPIKFKFVQQIQNRENRRRIPPIEPPPPQMITERGAKLPKWSTVKAFLLTVCVPLYAIFGIFYTERLARYIGIHTPADTVDPHIMFEWLSGLLMTVVLLIMVVAGGLIINGLHTMFEDLKDRFEE